MPVATVAALRVIAHHPRDEPITPTPRSHPIFRFPWRALCQYDPFAYTVICTSSGAANARNEDDGPNLEEFDGSSTIRRSDGNGCGACAGDARLRGHRYPVVACDDRPEQRRRGQARQRFQRFAERLQDRPELQGQLRRYAQCRDRRLPRRERAGHHAGVRGRHRDHDGGQGRRQTGLRPDEGSRARSSIPNPICRRSPDITRPRRARCCRSPSTRRAWCCGSTSTR